jgi:UDP-N-acetyl-D-mannosaminuronic acid dehydrogenase
MFATHGYEVLGVDIDERVVRTLTNRAFRTNEPGLNTLVQAALKSGNLRVASQPEPADAFIIAVPTPLHPCRTEAGDPSFAYRPLRRADLSYVTAAAESIVPHLRDGNLVLLESTVPPRTTVDVLLPILQRSGLRLGETPLPPRGVGGLRGLFVAHCPERVLPGQVLEELVGNDRVIGGVNRASAELARALYASFVQGTIFLTDATVAEMTKLLENTYRDVNIALANEFARIAERVGVNVWEAIELANHHPRVHILQPGPGVGGHCIAVDPWFLLDAAPEAGTLIRSARALNDGVPVHVVGVMRELLRGIPDPVVAVLGLAYKANIDDARESPAIHVVEALHRSGFRLQVNDPYVGPIDGLPGERVPLETVCDQADCVLLLTDHAAYRELDPFAVVARMRHRLLLDTRRCLDVDAWRRAGFRVVLLGDGRSMPGPGG